MRSLGDSSPGTPSYFPIAGPEIRAEMVAGGPRQRIDARPGSLTPRHTTRYIAVTRPYGHAVTTRSLTPGSIRAGPFRTAGTP